MENAEELVERYSGWLEAAETGDYSSIDFEEYQGNGLPSPLIQLSVHEQGGELEVDQDLVRAYALETGDLGYRNLQKLSKGTDVDPIGKKKDELLEELNSEYGGLDGVLDEIESREDSIELEFENIARESLVENGINGRNQVKRMLSEFTDNSTYEGENPLDELLGGSSKKGGENEMTDDEYNKRENWLSTAIENHNEYSIEQVHGVARLERKGVDVIDELLDESEEYRQSGMDKMSAAQSYLDHNAANKLGAIDDLVESLNDKIDNVDRSDRGNLGTAVEDTVNDITGWDNY